MEGRMRRALLIGAVLTTTLAACGWTQTGFDAGRTYSNPVESKITTANASTLQVHSIPGATKSPMSTERDPITVAAVLGNQIITQQNQNVIAYDRATCPRTDNGVCSPLWTRTFQQYLGSDGGTTMLFGRGSTDPAVIGTQ